MKGQIITQTLTDTPTTESSVSESLLQQAPTPEAWNAENGSTTNGSTTPEENAQESSIGEMPGEVSLSSSTLSWSRPLTPEQHEQKLLRDRARRAAKSKDAVEAASAKAALADEQMTQEERDRPYRVRLSAMIKSHDAARARRIAESQQRSAATKQKVVFR